LLSVFCLLLGLYKVSNANLQFLHSEAKNLCKKYKSCEFVHIPRLYNGRADLLSNKAMDSLNRRPYSSIEFEEQIYFDASGDSEIAVSFRPPSASNPLTPTYDIQQQYQRMGVSPTVVEKQPRKSKSGKIADQVKKPRKPRRSRTATTVDISVPQLSLSSSQVPSFAVAFQFPFLFSCRCRVHFY
jgi:hypothetical protein